MARKKLNSSHDYCACDNEFYCALKFVRAKDKYNLFSAGFKAPDFNQPSTCMSGLHLMRCRLRPADKPDCPIPLIDISWMKK